MNISKAVVGGIHRKFTLVNKTTMIFSLTRCRQHYCNNSVGVYMENQINRGVIKMKGNRPVGSISTERTAHLTEVTLVP